MCQFVLSRFQITIDVPPCPISSISYSNSTSLTIPAKNPVGLAIGIKVVWRSHAFFTFFQGTITVQDDAGNTVASVAIDASASA